MESPDRHAVDSGIVKQLEDAQLTAFDTEYVTEQLWHVFEARVNASYPSGEFAFIDMGGGTGRFADRVLDAFPKSRGVVLDNARLLLDKNTEHPRKRLMLSGIECAPMSTEGPFDIICFNWALHHLVESGYSNTRRAVNDALTAAKAALTAGGHVSVFENLYEGSVVNGAPGRLIFALTSSKALAPLMRRQGANTAGVGVCFRSRAGWLDVFAANGLAVEATGEDAVWRLSLKRKLLLHIGSIQCGHFWLSPR